MANSYNFDFLRTEHSEVSSKNSSLAPPPETSNSSPSHAIDFAAAAAKPDLEKQFDILAFLQAHRGSGFLDPSVIYRRTGIDLQTDTQVAEMLQRNEKVQTQLVPDPENPSILMTTYAYQAKYATVRDRASLLAQVNRMTHGIRQRDLLDSYPNVQQDVDYLIRAGDVIAVSNTEDKDKIMFPRGEPFLVELDGIASVPKQTNSSEQQLSIEVDMDPQTQIRRGEAISVGGQWFRVSSAVREGSLADQPARAQAPLSVVSLRDMSERNDIDGYIRPLTARSIPLDGPLSRSAEANITKSRSARERLQKLTHGMRGVTSQLVGSQAHASNPTTLASSFHLETAGASRRPHHQRRGGFNRSSQVAATTGNKKDLQEAAADPDLALYAHARRHGCTRDVRELYLATKTLVPEEDEDLRKVLVQHNLLDEKEPFRRKRLEKTNVDPQGKPKKRRYYERKNQRMTNTHLEGTEIGAILARAAERQQQGKAVGDGGM